MNSLAPTKKTWLWMKLRNFKRQTLDPKLLQLKTDKPTSWYTRAYSNLAGHCGYNKFVIICNARTGSNLLVSYLDSHPNIRCYPEIVLGMNEKRASWWYPMSPRAHRRLLTEPESFFVHDFGRKRFPRSIRAVGFKLLYLSDYTAAELRDSLQSVFSYLATNRGFRIIHLKRRNHLASCISRKRAEHTRAFTSYCASQGDPEAPMSLSYDECLAYFRQTAMYQQYVDDSFANHAKINVYYEDLVSHKEEPLRSIAELVGVQPSDRWHTSLKRQNLRPLSESITNYYELRQRFMESPYRAFFEDPVTSGPTRE